ncbi:geranylgeranyl reductase family protein [Thalassococcus lentus]|uniref:Geranylgeranyl reductase family protein n=1 Tax=Thalassococcus lentus TaxID=1210524 RepID=A0ABT4XN14_9RHOB|nr:geranylgeranyl reductase family protein [Thalassococcus lentus]MDA7423268.1 geranylgeranyl reductase family protein [Thalassococcus lentus]
MTAKSGQQTQKFDLIVIGAGPAGASAALAASRDGLRVALVDKRQFPRDKLCGGALTGRAVSTFQRLYQKQLPEIPINTCTSMFFHGFGHDLGRDENAPPLFLGMRRALDHFLLQAAAESGARTFLGESGSLDPETNILSLANTNLMAPLVIGADGVNSATAHTLFGQAFDRQKIGFALEVEIEGNDPDRELRIDFGAADWGYGWQFPKTNGTTIGLGGLLSQNADMKAHLARYLAFLNVHEPIKPKGQFLPFGDFRTVPGKGRVLLAGDAAGLVDPITGEGIGHAMESGALAANAVRDALQRKEPDKALDFYRQSLAPMHQSLRHARLLRNLIFRPAFRGIFIKNFQRSKRLRSEYLRLMAGETEYADLMKLTARRLPGAVLRSLKPY